MTNAPCQFDRVAVVGVGLIGGSLALAIKERGVARKVLGVGRNHPRLLQARQRGVIDQAVDSSDGFPDADLTVLCTPVDRIAEDARSALRSVSADALVTDAGSVKGAIVKAIASAAGAERFIGSHPLAGSHLTGWEHADARLFEGRMCIVTPQPQNDPERCARLKTFWESLGMTVREMSPEQHDDILAKTSHLPHLVAAALASLVDRSQLPYAAGGYRDTTRVAAGDPDLWTAILSLNARPVLRGIEELEAALRHVRQALEKNDEHDLRDWLQSAQTLRRSYDEHSPP